MKIKKISVFVVVVVFHLAVIGVVYLSTRDEEEKVNPAGEVTEVNPDDDSPEPKDPGTSNPVEDKPPVEGPADPVVEDKPPEPSKYTGRVIIHTVKKGDFLGAIATKYKVSVKQIMTLNDMTDPNKIHPGQKLKIPASN